MTQTHTTGVDLGCMHQETSLREQKAKSWEQCLSIRWGWTVRWQSLTSILRGIAALRLLGEKLLLCTPCRGRVWLQSRRRCPWEPVTESRACVTLLPLAMGLCPEATKARCWMRACQVSVDQREMRSVIAVANKSDSKGRNPVFWSSIFVSIQWRLSRNRSLRVCQFEKIWEIERPGVLANVRSLAAILFALRRNVGSMHWNNSVSLFQSMRYARSKYIKQPTKRSKISSPRTTSPA